MKRKWILIVVGVVIVLSIFCGLFVLGKHSTSQATGKQDSEKSSKSMTKLVTKKQIKKNNQMAAAATLSYAANHVKTSEWRAIKPYLKKHYSLKISSDGDEIKYFATDGHDNDTTKSPYYQINSKQDRYTFYSSKGKKVGSASLNQMISYVNENFNKAKWNKMIKMVSVSEIETNSSSSQSSSSSSSSFTQEEALALLKKTGWNKQVSQVSGDSSAWTFDSEGLDWTVYPDGSMHFPGDPDGYRGFPTDNSIQDDASSSSQQLTENEARALIGGANGDMEAHRDSDGWIFTAPTDSDSNLEVYVKDDGTVSNNQ